MKKMANVILILVCFFCLGLRAEASENREESADGMEITQITEGHEQIEFDGIVIDDYATENTRRIVTQIGDDVSEFYADYTMWIGVLTVNGRVSEIYDLEEFRENSESTWRRFDSDKLVWGLAIVLGMAIAGGGIWSCIPKKGR